MHNFVFDERSHLIVSIFMQSTAQTAQGKAYFIGMRNQYNVTKEELESFMNDWSALEHEMGWCKDPYCQVPNGPEEMDPTTYE